MSFVRRKIILGFFFYLLSSLNLINWPFRKKSQTFILPSFGLFWSFHGSYDLSVSWKVHFCIVFCMHNHFLKSFVKLWKMGNWPQNLRFCIFDLHFPQILALLQLLERLRPPIYALQSTYFGIVLFAQSFCPSSFGFMVGVWGRKRVHLNFFAVTLFNWRKWGPELRPKYLFSILAIFGGLPPRKLMISEIRVNFGWKLAVCR